ncbi:leucine rich adaptor protein 1-like [Coregonus clupeaformis]|uniref:leucine rich adaptor protein 1-like n=1 Tax=Coregonus clupeaformis TaxID=59861 RepID=UPI001BE0CE14|nr:leucine rich adaptor protein 1-like [Coregonus clupeaformis]
MEEDSVLSDFKDIEKKLGRKVPESLIRSLAGGNHHHDKHEDRKPATPKNRSNSADLKRLENKMLFLKQEMAHLRAIDVKLMQQLMSINEGIESIKWVMEDKGGIASRESSLTGSLYSLTDSEDDTSSRGSITSLHDGNSDGLDGISVGSYLDTLDELAEDLPDHPSPTDLDPFSDKPIIEDKTFSKPPMRLKVDSDEYYCFG